MARTRRRFPTHTIMTREEFAAWRERLMSYSGRANTYKNYTYEKYLADVTSDKAMRRLPSSEFRKKIVRRERSKQNQILRSQIVHGEEDIVLPKFKRCVAWEWW